MQIYGFSDASQDAYTGDINFWVLDTRQELHVSLILSKTRVAPIKRMTITHLELCGADLMADLLHVQNVFNIITTNVFVRTDSTILLH